MLESKVALVTGAGSGIGKAGAMAMARHGALVVVTDLDAGKAASVVAELENEGIKATSGGLDVTDDEAVFAEINRVVSKYGRLDVLHSHAGYQIEGNLEEVPDRWNGYVMAAQCSVAFCCGAVCGWPHA
jgi:NAD(P)-dependent dehydrogenase (short-subunit alcohol dehydrogenase family)